MQLPGVTLALGGQSSTLRSGFAMRAPSPAGSRYLSFGQAEARPLGSQENRYSALTPRLNPASAAHGGDVVRASTSAYSVRFASAWDIPILDLPSLRSSRRYAGFTLHQQHEEELLESQFW